MIKNKTFSDIPSHIPTHLVQEFDFVRDLHPGDVYINISKLHAGPDVFYTPCQGGHWVFTRAADMEDILKCPDDFSSDSMLIPRVEKPFDLLPIESNPPLHTAYREILQPFFSPKVIGDLEVRSRKLSNELIDQFIDKGECEFIRDFAVDMPVDIFMGLVDLPDSDATLLTKMVNQYLHGDSMENKLAAIGELMGYIGQKLEERKNSLGDDMLSAMLKANINGKPLNQTELIGFAIMVLLGGLETVTSALAMLATYLAKHDQHRHRLIAEPGLISKAIEELLRRHHGVMFPRVVKHDLVYKGGAMKAGEMVLLPVVLAGIDRQRYEDPFTVDFERKDKKHLAFGAGPHTCIGSFLGRTELKVFLAEWLKRIPDFSIKEGTEPVIADGFSVSITFSPNDNKKGSSIKSIIFFAIQHY